MTATSSSDRDVSGGVRVARAADAVSRIFDGRAVIITLDGGRIRTLSPSGTIVWAALEGAARNVDDLVDCVASEYPEQPRDAVAADVRAFVADLLARDLVVVVP